MSRRFRHIITAVVLLGLGLFASAPFFSRGVVGGGDAYNYSLAVADAVEQTHLSSALPMVGQTQYAFNGRVHPLRTAPYMFFLAIGLDTLTFRQLTFWQLQNLLLAASLIGAVLVCYFAIRSSSACPRPWAVFLAALYGLSPALLSAAYSFELFMTVCAAPFVPLAVAGCLRFRKSGSALAMASIAAAVGACWLAHPPVAAWLTGGVLILLGADLLFAPTWKRAGLISLGFGLTLVLSSYVALSVHTLDPGSVAFQSTTTAEGGAIAATAAEAFPGALLPVTTSPHALSDVQLGWVGWILLLALLASFFRRSLLARPASERAERGAIVAVVLFYAALSIPIPGLTRWLWVHLPSSALGLTGLWPMYRLYLVMAGFVVVGAGSLDWTQAPDLLRARRTRFILAIVASGWMAWEAHYFIQRGFKDSLSLAETENSFRPSNLDLTVTSYAFFGPPPWFTHGVADPLFDFSLIGPDGATLVSPLTVAEKASVVARGSLTRSDPSSRSFDGHIVLQPARKYLLTFAFATRPVKAALELNGPTLRRTYYLPNEGGVNGFGFGPSETKALVVSSDAPTPEAVTVTALLMGPGQVSPGVSSFADFELREIPRELPIRISRLVPLEFTVDCPASGCAVETTRRYIPGYVATVNGRGVPVEKSVNGQVLVPIEQGHSAVILSYAGSASLHRAAWLTLWAWVGVGIVLVPFGRRVAGWLLAPFVAFAGRHGIGLLWVLVGGAAAVAVGLLGRGRDDGLTGVGPVKVDFRLPYAAVHHTQPLVATGVVTAGTIIAVTSADNRHVVIQADVWGTLYHSEPIACDHFRVHTMVVNGSPFYPLGDARVREMDPTLVSHLRSHLLVELDGRTVLSIDRNAFESTASQIRIGAVGFGSTSEARFQGTIVATHRVAVPNELTLPPGQALRLRLRLPEIRTSREEPLLTVAALNQRLLLSVRYENDTHASLLLRDGKGVVQGATRGLVVDGQEHELDVFPDCAADASLRLGAELRLDGQTVLASREKTQLGRPADCVSAPASLALAGIDVRFTGPELSMERVERPIQERYTSGRGPIQLVVRFPRNRWTLHEPLVTTGRTGAGDVLYVIYEDPGHVRIGFDDWSRAGSVSDPIPVDYTTYHDLRISFGSLYPESLEDPFWGATPLAARQRALGQVVVTVDGRPVLGGPARTYPSSLPEITLGENRIGASTADRHFHGDIGYSAHEALGGPQRP